MFVNTKPGVISQAENKYLASFPSLRNANNKLNNNFNKEFESWINDNFGLRETFVKINQLIQYSIFNNSTIKDVHIGKEDWLYLADDNNIRYYQNLNIPTQNYMDRYTKKLNNIDNYLKIRGISFFAMFWPSKQTIYPEYMPNTILKVGKKTQTDVLINYVKNASGFDISEPIQPFLNEKEKRIIYSPRYDRSHWNNYGAFIGYTELINNVKKYIPNIKKLSLNDFNISQYNKQTNMFYFKTLPEEDYKFELKGGYHSISDKTYFDESGFSSLSKDPWKSYNRYINTNKNLPKALIIGDSYIWMFMLPDLAESFSDIIFIHYMDIQNFKQIVDYLNPDIVIYSTLEGAYDGLMYIPEDDLVDYNSYMNLPVVKDPLMWIDICNNNPVNTPGKIVISKSSNSVNLIGWAVDQKAGNAANSIYAKVGDNYYKGTYGLERTSVSDYYKNPNYKNSGFNFNIDTEALIDAGEVSFVIISKDKSYQYTPVNYKVEVTDK